MNARFALLTACTLILLVASACAPSAAGSSFGASASSSGAAASSSGASSSGAAAAAEAYPAADPTPVPYYPPKPGILTAGDIDDHLNFAAFQRYAVRMLEQHEEWPALYLGDRVTIRFTDRRGKPYGNAQVVIRETETGSGVFIARTGTDGTIDFFPTFDIGGAYDTFSLSVGMLNGCSTDDFNTFSPEAVKKDGGVLNIRLNGDLARKTEILELMLVIDTTGSMVDELRYLTSEFTRIIERVQKAYPSVYIHFGLVLYRDQGDAFVVKSFDFTDSTDEMQNRLWGRSAEGGGDEPEAVTQALDAALKAGWLPADTISSARVLIHVTDAPPHPEDYQAYLEQIRRFRRAGIRVYPIAASGVSDTAEYLMRHAALLTQARYLFLTDDSGVGNTHSEPKIPCYVVTRLDRLIERVVMSEISGGRVEPAREDIIRVTGAYENGICGE